MTDNNKIQVNLTDKWKKGELPEGKYWVKYKHWTDTVEMLDYSVGLFLDVDVPIEDDRIEKVIAEVPDYVEWRNMVNCACEEHEANKRLIEENDNFKETVEALESELKEVCDVLIRKCPEMKDWVMMNWKNLYELENA